MIWPKITLEFLLTLFEILLNIFRIGKEDVVIREVFVVNTF